MSGRIDQWKEEKSILTLFPGDKKTGEILQVLDSKFPCKNGPKNMTKNALIESAKELIYNMIDGKEVFHVIMHIFSFEKREIQICHILDIVDLDRRNILETLAMAEVFGIDVYPNSENLLENLRDYWMEMLVSGFEIPDGNDGFVRYRLTKGLGREVFELEHLASLDGSQKYSPLAMSQLAKLAREEIAKLRSAKVIVARLRDAIITLEGVLSTPKANEAEIQNILTNCPILFGLDYQRVLPKHKLGTEYEMDYALEKSMGLVDLVEIEASTKKLFTKIGRPKAELIHAEQQILDWLQWIEKHNSYARTRLPGIARPKGFIVIGRSTDLTVSDEENLRFRNQLYQGNIEILTYDDFLKRAKQILEVLTNGVVPQSDDLSG